MEYHSLPSNMDAAGQPPPSHIHNSLLSLASATDADGNGTGQELSLLSYTFR